jgi:hypothetical protein
MILLDSDDFPGGEVGSASHGRKAVQNDGVGPLAKIAARAHQ